MGPKRVPTRGDTIQDGGAGMAEAAARAGKTEPNNEKRKTVAH